MFYDNTIKTALEGGSIFGVILAHIICIAHGGLHSLGLSDFLRTYDDGCHGMFSAHSQTALGGVPKQVLQRAGVSVHTFQLRRAVC